MSARIGGTPAPHFSYSFTGGADGANPYMSYVLFDSVGNLYGTTYEAGSYGYGVVFELSLTGTIWTEAVLYSFAGGTDDANPLNGLIMDSAGNLYGRTYEAGGGSGTIFELSKSGGGWTKQVIYSDAPGYAGLTMDTAGNIFGVTTDVVFELSPNGHGGWNPNVIPTFSGGSKDGLVAEGTPVLDHAGNLYGTTLGGGSKNNGTVYKLSHGTNGWSQKILHSFEGGSNEGSEPFAGIVFDAAGNIYGTTEVGGNPLAGTVYELVAPVGIGSYKEKVLWKFDTTDGYEPVDSLILDSAGNLYRTTPEGGSNGYGVVFKVNVPAAWTTTTLTTSLNPSTYGQAVSNRIRKLSEIATDSVKAPEHRIWPIQRLEMYEDSAYINALHLPIELGDIFERNGGRLFMLIAPPCDLMVRSKGRRLDSMKEAILAEIIDEVSDERLSVTWELPQFDKTTKRYIDFKKTFSVRLSGLDLCVFNADGTSSITIDQPISGNLIPPWTARYAVLQQELKPIIKKIEANWKAVAIRSNLLNSLGIDHDGMFVPTVKSSTHTLEYNFKRLARLLSPRSNALLTSYGQFISRSAFEHDLERSKKIAEKPA